MSDSWKTSFEAEIRQAEVARAAGKEGMARVCARRAAGHVLAEYFARRGLHAKSPSAYDHLRSLAALPDTPPQVREAVQHFLVRVTPDFSLPVEIDLIAEARWLAEALLGPPVTS